MASKAKVPCTTQRGRRKMRNTGTIAEAREELGVLLGKLSLMEEDPWRLGALEKVGVVGPRVRTSMAQQSS